MVLRPKCVHAYLCELAAPVKRDGKKLNAN